MNDFSQLRVLMLCHVSDIIYYNTYFHCIRTYTLLGKEDTNSTYHMMASYIKEIRTAGNKVTTWQ